ncbi:MAG: hypothetical protein NVSMB5_25850 [Candidatus Velthaea sp.]
MTATRVSYDHFISPEANFVFALPAERFRIYEYSDAGDLSLVGAKSDVSGDAFHDRIDLQFFPGATSEGELARRFAEQRTRCRALHMREAGVPAAFPNTGDAIGYVMVPIQREEQSGFLSARPWFGGIIVCRARLARSSPDAIPVTSAAYAAWTWLRRERTAD